MVTCFPISQEVVLHRPRFLQLQLQFYATLIGSHQLITDDLSSTVSLWVMTFFTHRVLRASSVTSTFM